MKKMKEETLDEIADDICELAERIGKVITKFILETENQDLRNIPIVASACAMCVAKVADAANHAMERKDQREELLKIITTFLQETPDFVTHGKTGH